jgi:hypothetical protein
MSIAEKLQTIAENEQRVYDAGYAKGQAEGGDTTAAYDEGFEAGKKAENDAFWDAFQKNGEPMNYYGRFAGGGWTDENFKPKHDIKTTDAQVMFFSNSAITNLKQLLLDANVILDTSLAQTLNNAFSGTNITHIPYIDGRSVNAYGYGDVFSSSRKLKHIDGFYVVPERKFSNTFSYCEALEHLIMEGTIGQNGLDLHWSTKLSKASIESIINHLSTTTSGLTVTLSKTAKEAAFTADEWAALIATRNNWTISLV